MTNDEGLKKEDTEGTLNNEEEEDPILKFKKDLENKENEIIDLSNKIARLQADFVNYKRRAEKDKEQSIGYGIESISMNLLPIIDNFQRALEAHEDKEDGFYIGIKMIERQLVQLLEDNQVFEIPSVGEIFDPNFHNAVSMIESEEESGIIIEVLQKGYKFKEKVIRPSMVIVSK